MAHSEFSSSTTRQRRHTTPVVVSQQPSSSFSMSMSSSYNLNRARNPTPASPFASDNDRSVAYTQRSVLKEVQLDPLWKKDNANRLKAKFLLYVCSWLEKCYRMDIMCCFVVYFFLNHFVEVSESVTVTGHGKGSFLGSLIQQDGVIIVTLVQH